ncbi:MAG: flagellar type III secretion system pore protein FliP [Alphaproteobacteria bacterium]
MTRPTVRALVRTGLIGLAALAATSPALAQDISLDFGEGPTSTGRIIQIIVMVTVLTLAPSILVMVTSFTRIVVVLSFLRTAMGTQSAPPNTVIVSLALFLTFFVMAPVLEEVYAGGLRPLIDGEIDEQQAFEIAIVPIREFMLVHVREQDLRLFVDLARSDVETAEEAPLSALIPAFMISELRRAFEIGFLIFLPFLVIDMVVASVLMSMGMMMLPPVMISLPFKLIFFVLVDGWYLVAGSLVESFNTV